MTGGILFSYELRVSEFRELVSVCYAFQAEMSLYT
jgi:hypothetical protein